MLIRFFNGVKSVLREQKYQQVRDVLWFLVITLVIHYLYRLWAYSLYYFPVQELMNGVQDTLTGWVFDQSTWVNRNILNINMNIKGHTMWFDNGIGLRISLGCSGDKQILQFAILMLLYPGPWKHKLWFIPMGIVIVHLTNILRIVLLSIVAINEPDLMKTAHDTVLRGMFYLVIFFLWVIWTEKIRRK